jgi:HD-GYP domain-containing protein (c-di-GMP phosphodiesterase class II)
MGVEKYKLSELKKFIKSGKTYRLFKPFFFKDQILINIEKILTVNDLNKLEGKIHRPIEVVSTVNHNTTDKIRKSIAENAIKILKTSKIFKLNDSHHLDFDKRKECEKLLISIINGNPHLAKYLLILFQHSKKLFIHSIRVGIIATIIDLGLQDKKNHYDGLRSEIILTASLLHDIGFLKLPKTMVEKRRIEFNDEEMELYNKYPSIGKKILIELGDNFRKQSLLLIEQHREKLSGDGFPIGLKEDHIHQFSLIVGLADDFELMASNETSNNKTYSQIMSKISRMHKTYGSDVVDSFYTWFRYLK